MNQVIAQNQGLKDLVEVVDFVFIAVDTFKKAKEDGGGINLLDLPKVLDLIKPADIAFDGYEVIPSAWLNATDIEKEAVYLHFKEKFDLADDKLELKIEKGVRIAYLVADFVIEF